jgi:hypothetical protein
LKVDIRKADKLDSTKRNILKRVKKRRRKDKDRPLQERREGKKKGCHNSANAIAKIEV